MRHAGALLPYAVAAVFIVGTSALALGLAVADVRDARDAAAERPVTATSAPARSFPELSPSGRLAYWRSDPAGGGELMASNLDGTLRRALARVAAVRRMAATRWTPDGEAVAYVDNGVTLVVARLDGTRTELTLPDEVRALGGRIAEHRWAMDGSRVAASVVRADLRSDVYVARPPDGPWVRATTLDDVFVSDWLDPDHVLIHTGGGIIGSLREGETNAIRPLTGMTATSPILADDGRIHFVRGSVTSVPRDITLPYLTASGAAVWSMRTDGSDVKRETQGVLDDARIVARYAPGQYLGHRGSSQLQVLIAERVVSPPIDAGPVERIIVAPDARSAIGFSATRIVRFDLVRAAPAGTFPTPTVMLDSVFGGDVWHPRPARPAAAAVAERAQRPDARYAFTLGGHLWTMGPDGIASFLRAGSLQTGRRAPPPPPWSPTGERLLMLQLAGPGVAGVTPSTPIAVSIDRAGGARTYAESRAATGTPSWSPGGDAFAVVVDGRGVDGAGAQAELEVRFLSVDGVQARPPVRARDATWTRGGVLLLTDTAIEIANGATRHVIHLAAILDDPRAELSRDRTRAAFSSLAATPDGAFASVRVAVTPASGPNQVTTAVIRLADGRVVGFLGGAQVQDATWAPVRDLLGLTITGTPEPTSQVRQAATDRLVASQPGRFAGWSPDAQWYYVARAEGLFAHPVAGGEPVRVSAIGVPVSTARP